MRIQLLSDLHLETERFEPQPAPGAELLVLAGDIDATWSALERFGQWPQPVLFVAGNHEFDSRELDHAWPALRERCEQLRITLLERQTITRTDAQGRCIRFIGTLRWSDFDSLGPAKVERALRSGQYFQKLMRATRHGDAFDVMALREEALACRAWLSAAIAEPTEADATVVITHFAPSLQSADPRYGLQPSTAAFCNGDEALMPGVDVWIHGHVHCRHDYRVTHGIGGATRVVANARGHTKRGEADDFDGSFCLDV